MSKSAILFCVLAGLSLVVLYVPHDVGGREIAGDLAFAASDKRTKWEKGGESDHHESDHGEKGEKADEEYESKHGFVAFTPPHGEC